MFAVYNRGRMWDNVFDTIEEAKQYTKDWCADWEPEDFDNFTIVEIVPRVEAILPPAKIIWNNLK